MIKDPGNAGAANNDDDILNSVAEATAQRDRSRRVMALVMSLLSGFVLLPAVLATLLTFEWRWFLGGLGIWLALAMVASGVVTYRYGPRPYTRDH